MHWYIYMPWRHTWMRCPVEAHTCVLGLCTVFFLYNFLSKCQLWGAHLNCHSQQSVEFPYFLNFTKILHHLIPSLSSPQPFLCPFNVFVFHNVVLVDLEFSTQTRLDYNTLEFPALKTFSQVSQALSLSFYCCLICLLPSGIMEMGDPQETSTWAVLLSDTVSQFYIRMRR